MALISDQLRQRVHRLLRQPAQTLCLHEILGQRDRAADSARCYHRLSTLRMVSATAPVACANFSSRSAKRSLRKLTPTKLARRVRPTVSSSMSPRSKSDLFRCGRHKSMTRALHELTTVGVAQTRAKKWKDDPASLDETRFLADITEIGKGRFAQRLANIIAGMTSKKCPDYILQAINYVAERVQ